MKYFLFISVLLLGTLHANSIEHLNIGKQDFMFTTESYDIYDSKGEVLRVYKEHRNHDLSFMFSLILKDRTGACSDKSLEDGYYEINGTSIILYSHWDRRGKAYDAPYGVRIQVYTLDEHYNFVKTSSTLYIETQRANYNENSGMKYLFKATTNEKEKAKLDAYIAAVEHTYKGKFVQGNEAKELIKEVQNAMTRKMKSMWK